MNILKTLEKRYAVRKFDERKKVSPQDLENIIQAFRLTPSSFWLQPWKLIVVENQELKNRLVQASYGQEKVAQASQVLVFARVKSAWEELINAHIQNTSKITGTSLEWLQGYKDSMTGYFARLSNDEKSAWAQDQVMISVGFVLSYLATQGIDSCPIGGFVGAQYDEILGLDNSLETTFVIPIGYRDLDDEFANYPKVRFDTDDVVIRK